MRQIFDDMLNTLKTPFVGELDLMHLFLLVGAVLVFAAAWAMILSYARAAGEAVVETVT